MAQANVPTKCGVLRTLAYHHLFQDPLTIEQIHEFLITPDPVSLASVHRSVEQLLRKHQIIRCGSYSALLHFTKQNVRRHADRMEASQVKLAIARRAAKMIAFVPWVKLVAVTGALAMEHADESDDIDLMIVTSRNRLWFTRPLIAVLVSLFFKRRKAHWSNSANSTNMTNSICLNLWLDESSLAIPASSRNLYTAHELAQMKPVVNRNGTYERMMSVNKWGREFLVNAWEGVEGQGTRAKGQGKPNSILTLLNKVSYQLQIWYMKSKMTTERVSLHAAYFHPGNRSKEILRRYRNVLRKLSL